MNPNLFVYGTLLSSAGHPRGARLRREARLVGAASIPGRLYRLGSYPGLVEGDPQSGQVHGEVYALHDPARAFRWLDPYEAIVPGDHDNEYERVERPVRLAAGKDVAAWVYLYRRSITGLQPIPDGRWVAGHR